MQKEEITTDDFRRWPVWRFDLDTDLYSPLESLDQEIESLDELHFFAKFTTPQGIELLGSIAGRGDIAIGIFENGRWYAANVKWKDLSLAQLDALAADTPELAAASGKELLPLKFRTLIHREPYIDWAGTFNLP